MARNAVHHLPAKRPGTKQKTAPNIDTADMVPRELTKHEFGRRLQALMLNKGWNQSDLARAAVLGRDAISTYIRGVSFPDPKNLRKLAKALDCSPEDLLPNTILRSMDSDPTPMMEIRMAHGAPGKAWLRINRLVSTSTAAKIFELLEADNTTVADAPAG